MPAVLADAVQALLLRHPATFRSSKAMLLTELTASGGAPTLGPLAGAQFTRWTKSWKQALTEAKDWTSVTLDVGRLVALEPLGTSPVTGGIAFLEPLEDALYDNSFEVRDGRQLVEPFEAVIDTEAAAMPGWMWTTALPVTPIKAEYTAKRRCVPLASRRPVAPPIQIGAVKLDPTVGGLASGTIVSLPKLVEGLAGSDPAGTYSVDAVLDDVNTSPLSFENDVFRLIYLVQGDEEGDAAGSPTAFQNDLFSIERTGPQPLILTQPSDADGRPQRTDESALSKDLRLLAAASGGTAEARQWLEKILPSLATVATDYVRKPLPGVAPGEGLVVKVTGPTIDLGYRRTKPLDLRNAALLRPVTGTSTADRSVAVLVLDVLTDMWGDVGFSLRQSRNSGEVLHGYEFDPYFMTSAMPKTPPARHRVTKAAENVPANWRRQRLIDLPARSIAIPALLTLLADADVGPHTTRLFTPAAALASGYRLVVSVWAEQFQRPAWGAVPLLPEGRHLPFTIACMMTPDGLKDAPEIQFTPQARHFSIDLQWWTPSGESALRLGRIFAVA